MTTHEDAALQRHVLNVSQVVVARSFRWTLVAVCQRTSGPAGTLLPQHREVLNTKSCRAHQLGPRTV